MAKKEIYDLKITLCETNPVVWRRLLIPEGVFLDDLHALIQLAMGWGSKHLFEFNIDGKRYCDQELEEFETDSFDAYEFSIGEAVGKTQKFHYTYDFGDNWSHEVEVMGIIPVDENTIYPICIGGENACPPEDCGGVPGYEDFLEALRDTKHESHEDMKSWVGGYFDPKGFDANLVNRILRAPDPDEHLEQVFEEMGLDL